jgi:hypothetical protein
MMPESCKAFEIQTFIKRGLYLRGTRKAYGHNPQEYHRFD